MLKSDLFPRKKEQINFYSNALNNVITNNSLFIFIYLDRAEC